VAAIVWTDVSGAFPGDASIVNAAVPAQTITLSIVNGSGLDAANFGGEEADLTKSARIFYAAHIATLIARRGIGGGIASQSEGQASQSYWNAFASPRLLHTTGYGQLLAQLIMGTPARAGALL
jgi:hypothetical protein